MSDSDRSPTHSGHAGSSRERAVFYSMIMGLVNLLPRIFVALISGSVTLYTDALRSITETLANFCSWRTVRRIARGGEAGYEYGLGKHENLASILIVCATLVTMVVMGVNSIHRLVHPVTVHRLGWGLLVSFLSGLVSWVLWRKSRRASKAEPSPLMESHWRLMRNKFLGNVFVITTLVLNITLCDYPSARYIDPLGSLLLCGFICFSLYGMLAGAFSALLDKTLDENLQIVILRHLAGFESCYEQFHAIRSRRAGSQVFIELFLEFGAERRMAEVQDDMDAIRKALERDIPGSCVVVVPSRGAPGCRQGHTTGKG